MKHIAGDSDEEDYPHPPPTLHPDPDLHPEMYPENPNIAKKRAARKALEREKELDRIEREKERKAAKKALERERKEAIERGEYVPEPKTKEELKK